jgi:hypothetical protein
VELTSPAADGSAVEALRRLESDTRLLVEGAREQR